ncbi:hypothetical protein Mapa_000846 [Marchantia paleacea]|nr:hypothetical protein Mapa_000846 [Marchantia paleacea]
MRKFYISKSGPVSYSKIRSTAATTSLRSQNHEVNSKGFENFRRHMCKQCISD